METAPSRLTSVALAFMALIWVSPFAWLVLNAFDPLSTGRLAIPQSIGLDNFAQAVSGNAGRQFLNSVYIAAGTATLTVVVGIAAAYPLSRLKIPGRNAFLWSLVLLRMLPAAGVLVPLYFSAQSSGLLNIFGIIIALTILNLPFTLLLLKNFFDTVPIELEEAAYVEGASLWQIVTSIVLPMSRAGIAVVWFFSLHRRLERVPAAADLLAGRGGLSHVGGALCGFRAKRGDRIRLPRRLFHYLRSAGGRRLFPVAAKHEHGFRRCRS